MCEFERVAGGARSHARGVGGNEHRQPVHTKNVVVAEYSGHHSKWTNKEDANDRDDTEKLQAQQLEEKKRHGTAITSVQFTGEIQGSAGTNLGVFHVEERGERQERQKDESKAGGDQELEDKTEESDFEVVGPLEHVEDVGHSEVRLSSHRRKKSAVSTNHQGKQNHSLNESGHEILDFGRVLLIGVPSIGHYHIGGNRGFR